MQNYSCTGECPHDHSKETLNDLSKKIGRHVNVMVVTTDAAGNIHGSYVPHKSECAASLEDEVWTEDEEGVYDEDEPEIEYGQTDDEADHWEDPSNWTWTECEEKKKPRSK